MSNLQALLMIFTNLAETPAQTSLLIADDCALVRTAVRSVAAQLLPRSPVVEVSDNVSLLRAAGAANVHRLAVVSAAMLGVNAEVLHDLAHIRPALPVVVVSAPISEYASHQFLRVRNVRAVLDKNADSLQLQCAMEAVLRGDAAGSVRGASSRPQQSVLTERQREVYRLMCEGFTNKRIARALNISAGTVKNHMSEIFKILNAANRTHAARLNHPT